MVDSVGKRRLVTSVIIQRGRGGVLRGRREGVVFLPFISKWFVGLPADKEFANQTNPPSKLPHDQDHARTAHTRLFKIKTAAPPRRQSWCDLARGGRVGRRQRRLVVVVGKD